MLSYGVDQVNNLRRAATYVDRILRGTKPGDLPVQLPTKFEMVVNRKTATALGLAIPPSILLRASAHGPSGGVADSLDEAKSAFRAAWEALG